MPRFTPFIIAGACLLAGIAFSADTRKPNVLVIVADDLGYGEVGAQGFTNDIPTPNIDSIAKSGIRFTNGYVSGPYCSPTRAALLTGRYQQRMGHEFNPGPAQSPVGEKVGLDLSQKTLGDHLKTAGYATAWIGKSHLGYAPEFHPNKRGFDEFTGFLGGAHPYMSDVDRDPIQHNGRPLGKFEYLTDTLGGATADFIGKNKDNPWFVYLAFNAVHSPLESTDKYLKRFENIKDPKRKNFAAMMSAMDDSIGMVLGKVRENGQEENTLVFFISDNGGPTQQTTSANGPLRGFKAQTWEGGIRVPWMVQWKGKIPAGKVDPRPVIQIDILPTALAAAGVEAKPEWKVDGVNLLPFMTGDKADAPHQALFWRFGNQVAVRMGDWKLVKGAGMDGVRRGGEGGIEGAELYNLAEDIGEKTNVASKNPEKVKELEAAWNAWNKDNIPAKWGPPVRAGARRQQQRKEQ